MKQLTENILKEFDENFKTVENKADLEKARLEYLGKKGKITELMSHFREIPNDQKKEAGIAINGLKNYIESKLAERLAFLEEKELQDKINDAEVIDITMPVDTGVGSLHPRTIIQKQVEDVFVSMGFVIEDGDEIVSEFENFDAVNVPETHPARDMQDTFWLNNGQVLKTHTSAMQNRILKKYNGEVKAIFPGRCFRNEALDHSHENTFFQLEGIVARKGGVSISNLIYFMKEMLSKVFKKELEVRLRPGYFPFVEPGFEMDVQCPFCGGKGCSVCKNGGWLELCPCGMIHPKVFEKAGLDPKEYVGFAFGLGFDRLVMIKSGLDDIRHLNSGNLKVLKQFGTKM